MATTTTKPAPKGTFTGVVLASDTGISGSDKITSNGGVTFSGTVSDVGGPGIASVKVYNGSVLIGTAVVLNGVWSLSTTLAEGSYKSLKIVATDTAGLSTTITNATPIVVDKTPPVLTITSQRLAKDTGSSPSDLVTNNGLVTLSGRASGLTGTVRIFDGDVAVGTATVTTNGTWTFTTTLGDGAHALRAVAMDLAGNTTSTAAQPTITVDTSHPVVAFRWENQVVGSNSVQLFGSITASPGTRIDVYSGTTLLGQATITGDTWAFDTPQLAPGDYAFTAVATTPAGLSTTFGGIPSLTVGPSSGTLDLSRFTTLWRQDFTTSTAIDTDIFPIIYGNPADFVFSSAGLTMTSHRADGFPNIGFLQANWGRDLSQGYGLYTVTASHPANQGAGIAILLWPTDNAWPGPEIDMVEDWSDPTSQTAYMSVHFRGPDGTDMANTIRMAVNLTVPNTFALDWEQGSLTYYINGQQVFRITGSEVPSDAAHGGVNAAFGAQVTDIGDSWQPSDEVSLTVLDMSYSAAGAIRVSDPGAATAATQGAPVTVTETVTGIGLHTQTVYAIVLSSSYVAYDGWQAVTLDANGVGSFQATFFNTGDYVVVTTDPTNQTLNGYSAPITVTSAAPLNKASAGPGVLPAALAAQPALDLSVPQASGMGDWTLPPLNGPLTAMGASGTFAVPPALHTFF
jgi:hypothetical protein